MIISNSRKYVFFHVPKSGGTSITKLLDSGISWNDIIIGGTKTGEVFNGDWARRFRIFKHTTPPGLKRVIGEHIFGEYFKFLFVRDPISRFKSATQFLYQVVKEERDWVLRAYSEDHLNEIIGLRSVAQAISSSFFTSICDKNPGSCNESEMCFKPQSIFYDLLRSEYGNSSSFFRLENLGKSLESLIGRGVLTPEEVDASAVLREKSNQSQKLLEEGLDDSAISRLKVIFESDFAMFGY